MKEQARGKSRKKKNRKSWLIPVAAAAAAVVVTVAAVIALRGRDTLIIKEPVHTYINGIRLDWEDGIKLSHKDDITTMTVSGEAVNIGGNPLILSGSSAVLFQKNCSWNRTADDIIYRLDYYTEVQKETDGIVIRRRGKESRDISGFIYDNSDTYLFLEPFELTYNGKTERLEPMTVVQAFYQDSIQIFSPYREPVFEYLETEEVIARFDSGKRVNVATDRFYSPNGSWRLLFLPLEVLPEMK